MERKREVGELRGCHGSSRLDVSEFTAPTCHELGSNSRYEICFVWEQCLEPLYDEGRRRG